MDGNGDNCPLYKTCRHCKQLKEVREFPRRTGRKAGENARRTICRSCYRKKRAAVQTPAERHAGDPNSEHPALLQDAPPKTKRKRRKRKKNTPQTAASAAQPLKLQPLPPRPTVPVTTTPGLDISILQPDKKGVIRMRGKTDKGKRWAQETDLETAVVLVREYAAVVVNKHTIRRLYKNKAFRQYILTRDNYTCYFCGEPGDTIDHLVPRSKGGHTTPVNCVCACTACNQSKADRNLDDFLSR